MDLLPIEVSGQIRPLHTDTFDHLCELAAQAYGEELEVSYESSLIDILNFVKDNQHARIVLIARFKDLLSSRNGPIEAVAFCMHELRWPEIYDYAVEKMNSSSECRSEAFLRGVILAYSDDWPDSDLYTYYGYSPQQVP